MSRKHKSVAFAALVAFLLLLVLWRGISKRADVPDDTEARAQVTAKPQTNIQTRVKKQVSKQMPTKDDLDITKLIPKRRLADLIGEITTDKSTLCPGEDFMVSISPESETAGDSPLPIAELNFNISGKYGDDIVLHGGMTPGPQSVDITASNGVDKIEHRQIEVEVLDPESPECMDKPLVMLEVRRDLRDQNAVLAKVTATKGLEGTLSYHWDFDDDMQFTTQEPEVRHSYAFRAQERNFSTYVVQVSVVDESGREAIGRNSIHLQNRHYKVRAFGMRITPVEYERFPRVTPDGLRFRSTLQNLEDNPVRFDNATLTLQACTGGVEDMHQKVDPKRLLGVDILPAGSLEQTHITLPHDIVTDDTCRVLLSMRGDTVPPKVGQPMENSPIRYRPVTADFTFDIRAPKTLEEGGPKGRASRKIDDKKQLEQLRAISAMLGSDRITPAQLAEFEQQGNLN